MSNPAPHRPRVLVVGAGLSGLATAWDLQRRGFEVRVFEASDAAGGRARASVEDGVAVERGIHTIARGDARLSHWIRGLGLQDKLLPARRIGLAQVRDGNVEEIEPGTVLGRARIAGLGFGDAMRTLRLRRLMARYRAQASLDAGAPEGSARWDDRSAADFAKLYFGASSFERWVAPALCSVYGSDPNETSRVAFLMMLQAGLEDGQVYGLPRGPLQVLIDKACDALDVRMRHRVERVEAADSGYRVLVHHGGKEVAEEADAIVLTAEVDEVARIAIGVLAPAERDFLLDASYAPSIAMTLAVEGPLLGSARLLRVPHAEGSSIDAALIDPSGEERTPHGLAHVVAVATERFALSHAGATDEVVQKSLHAAVDRVAPGVLRGTRFAKIVRTAKGVPHFQVGAYRNLARMAAVQADRRAAGRRVYFAGDYLSGPRAEDAVASGLRAAGAVATDLA